MAAPAMSTANQGSTTSSMTSTSHTLTAFPTSATNSSFRTAQTPKGPMADFLGVLAPEQRYAQMSSATGDLALQFSKEILDSLAGRLGDEQVQRQREARRKRKRGEKDGSEGQMLKIRKLHAEGFETGQVWEQARRVIGALVEDVEGGLEEGGFVVGEEVEGSDEDQLEVNGIEESDDEDLEGGEEFSSIGEDESDGLGEEEEEEDELEEDMERVEGEDEGDFEGFEEENDFDEEEHDSEQDDEEEEAGGVYIQDKHNLNDGFFSVDDFNKQTEFLERQDTAADPYTGEASDEEEIDWDLDPMSVPVKSVSNKKQTKAKYEEDEAEEEDDEDEGDGPTFGNMDLDAPEGDSDDGDDDDDDIVDDKDDVNGNTNTILYKDFFEPPPRKASKGERQQNYLDRQARKAKPSNIEDDMEDMARAKAAVSRDLFDDLSEHDDSDNSDKSKYAPGDARLRRSGHERKQAKLLEEIRRLEAASVAKRNWTLSGEARAADRPLDSLIQEELDFEHVGKTVPEVTAEVNEDIEDLIKRRILAQQFDEVIRRRPDSLNTPANTRRGAFELDDTKPKQSLAEMYEEEHVKEQNPDTYVSKADEKLRKEEKEIEAQWKEVSAQLDALSSWHYKPKPAAPSLTIVGDVATISMEDAQPSTAAGVSGGDSMLAPQEVYRAGKDKDSIEKGEIVTKGGAPVARDEMTREEKKQRRRRAKEAIRNKGGEDNQNVTQSKKALQKKDTMGELKRGGVKVIDRRGNITDVDGNKVAAAALMNGAGGFKL